LEGIRLQFEAWNRKLECQLEAELPAGAGV